ncbi:MAG: glycerol-3-phosphate responsive antiterminator, partial [Oscillospiraceae bacterium]|nr:glycerol-3-phosphate responsive antiterminator [Oscillospiraceae bacterium]
MHPALSLMEENPVIAAVRDPARWQQALASPAPVLFLLCGDILTARGLVDVARVRGKQVFVHMELLGGLGRDNRAVDFIAG